METGATTASTTLSLCHAPSTTGTTCLSGLRKTPAAGSLRLRLRETLQKFGTRLMKAVHGTLSTPRESLRSKYLQRLFAPAAANPMKVMLESASVGFAPLRASTLLGLPPASMTSLVPAPCVEPSSAPTSTQRSEPALRIVGKRSYPRQDVYGLTVSDAGVYYANGVLVSNCDSMQYLCLHADAQQGGKLNNRKAQEIAPSSMMAWT
jgi:hypothetical protein